MRHLLPAVVCLAASTAGCPEEAPDASTPDTKGPPPMVVELGSVRDGLLTDQWTFLGETHASTRAELAAGADGEVVELTVRLGDRVEKGDLLVRIDPSLARARVAAAEASSVETDEELELASRERQRAERLGASVLSESEIEQNVTRAQALRARAQRLSAAQREARVQLHRHRLVAPFSGVISARYVDLGDWVSIGEPIVELVDDAQVEVIVSVTPELVSRIERNTPVEIHRNDQKVGGHVTGIVRALDPVTRTAPLRIVPDADAPWILPGRAVDVHFTVEHRTDDSSVIVPRDAVVQGAVSTRVVKAVDDTAHLIPVDVIACADLECLVRGEGLGTGDAVVIRGNERLRPNQPLTVRTSEPATQTAAATSTEDAAKG